MASNNADHDRSDGAPLFRMSRISKNFGGLKALVNVDLILNAGEVLALCGDNGAGKSTLIKVATGVYQPNVGKIELDGTEIALSSPAEAKKLGIQCVHQTLALADMLGAPENLFLGAELTKSWFGGLIKVLDNKRMRKESAEALRDILDVELPNPDQPVYYRSGGQKQSIAIARAIYKTNPKLIILDEPTAALGPEETEKTLELTRKLRDQGYGVILISHNLEEVMAYADRVMVLWRGQKIGERTISETSRGEILQMIMGSNETVARANA
ncbi:ATP-binding cassette domain-containing protein [Roseinatronobacter monicus]|uniref:Monosaccharide ABC transporter ATP-binding protein (CUT2 family) n=1 Tax=Roseinatronobacter monicus TaxID=393481 RepID=A0A543K3M4_9RHOB|nr:ATP-binding cassette domain-containing protein [Roseinatronobacter monicus]TQM89655.1 monosaccharide ABC transporter ATP-binding protein (CUT2 family) [Roseinatronobacter monicus]